MLKCLSDDKVEVRRSAIQSLGRLGKGTQQEKEILEALRKFLDDPDPLTKLNAIVAEASIVTPDDSAIPTLLAAISNKDEATAKAAGRVLTDIAIEKPDKVLPGLIEMLDKTEEPAVINTLKVLRLMKVAAVPAMPKISSLYDKADTQVRMEILYTLAGIDPDGDKALPVLVKALKAPEPMVRKEALMGVMRYRSKADLFLAPLSESLKEGDLENRLLGMSIVRGLGEQGLKALPTLEELTKDPNVRVRMAAISALTAFRPPPEEVLETLGRSIKDSDHVVRLTTANALRQIGYVYPEKVTGMLQSALQEEKNEQTRRAMASALAGISKAKSPKPVAPVAAPDPSQRLKPKYSR